MKCRSCGFENPDGMKFCGNCAEPLLISPSSTILIYGWFTEGFGTRDLREAKALLDELS
jgi:hypothetical protein